MPAAVSALAVIPARGGSKGIPRKNVRPLAGVPLIGYTIDAARNASLIDRVVVSTDDDEIGEVSVRWGAEVVKRPAELAGDRSPSEAAVLHALDVVEGAGYVPELVLLLQCTSPLRRAGDLDAAIRMVDAHGYDSLFAGVALNHFRWRRAGDVMARVNVAVDDRPMRQEREPELIETGSFYVTRRELLRATGLRLGGRIGCYELPLLYSFDIDEPDDFLLCEALLACGVGGLATAHPGETS
jgi:CMP-N,N'-diacetyllegionaminic acid synthase